MRDEIFYEDDTKNIEEKALFLREKINLLIDTINRLKPVKIGRCRFGVTRQLTYACCNLDGKGLTLFPPEVCRLTNLKLLNISDNRIEKLPAHIGELHKLKVLYAGNNRLKTIPSEIGKLSKLETLDLSSNKLYSIPSEIINLKLIDLNLENNPIE
jgi:hypothetical protein